MFSVRVHYSKTPVELKTALALASFAAASEEDRKTFMDKAAARPKAALERDLDRMNRTHKQESKKMERESKALEDSGCMFDVWTRTQTKSSEVQHLGCFLHARFDHFFVVQKCRRRQGRSGPPCSRARAATPSCKSHHRA